MRFPNAFQGVKKLFTAEILNIIAWFCMCIAAVAGIVAVAGAAPSANGASLTDAQAATALGGGIGAVIFLVAYFVLALISFILTIIGLAKARKDDANFNIAFIFLFVNIALTFIGTLVTGTFGGVLIAFGNIASLVMFIYTVLGIRSLAEQLNNEQVASKGKTILTILVCVYVLSFIARLVSAFTVTAVTTTISGILAIVSIVLSIVGYIIFLTYLAQAKKMLA